MGNKQGVNKLEIVKLKLDNQKSVFRTESAFSGLKMLKFTEGKDNIHDFLRRFERLAKLQNCEWKNYHVYLSLTLTGKSTKTYISLLRGFMFNYDHLQDALINTYSVDAESYRRKFRESKVNDNETFS